MTIASCLVLPEGVVFGADSTTSTLIDSGLHHLNHNQKIFEVGEHSTLAVLTWGLSGFKDVSYRTLIAQLADELRDRKPDTVETAAKRLSEMIWDAYNEKFEHELKRVRELEAKPAVGSGAVGCRTPDEDWEYKTSLDELKVGFCLGGYIPKIRTPDAYYFVINPTLRSPSLVSQVVSHELWGQPSLFLRLYDGFDYQARKRIMESEYWKGSEADLDAILDEALLVPPHMTMRDGVDFVHFSIYATIKALKFSSNDQDCGGPIELAVITTDRNFRWIRHKEWDSAIGTQIP